MGSRPDAGDTRTMRERMLCGDLYIADDPELAAARDPALRAVTQDWMSRSRRTLERHVDPVTAREVEALVEGLVLHSALSTDPMSAAQIRSALFRLAC